jgi:hypothetical protein
MQKIKSNNLQARHQALYMENSPVWREKSRDLVQLNLLLSTMIGLQMSSLEQYLEIITTSRIHTFFDKT